MHAHPLGMHRTVQPELLDSLPAEDPGAIKSRRDLRIINRLMGNSRWLENEFSTLDSSVQHCLEIGAGDGTLALRLQKAGIHKKYTALDLAPEPINWPSNAEWLQADLLSANIYAEADTLVANLILHHFEKEALQQLGNKIQTGSIQHILISEPCRRARHKVQLASGRLLGFNYVTLHDGRVSVDAGFRGDELPELLGLNPDQWLWEISETWMGAYRMKAERR